MVNKTQLASIVSGSTYLSKNSNHEGGQIYPAIKRNSHIHARDLFYLNNLSKDCYKYDNETLSF